MSAPGRSQALIPERAARRFSMSAPGRSQALVPERKRGVVQ
jgi:hypothetical protein